MSKRPERSGRETYARAQLICREAREDLVALQRDELSPLRAETVRQHLASCPECREGALDVELAIRSWSVLPELAPPPGLADLAVRRVIETGPGDLVEKWSHELAAGSSSGPSEEQGAGIAAAPPPVEPAPGAQAPVSAAAGPPAGGPPHREVPERKATKVLPAVPPPSGGPPGKVNVLFRSTMNPLVRLAAAAVLLLAVVSFTSEAVGDVVGRAQRRILGPRTSEALADSLGRAAEAVLRKLGL